MTTTLQPARTLVIRRARISDIEAMIRLLADLFTIEKDFAPDDCKQRKGLLALLAEPGACLLVAEVHGVVAGMCTAQTAVSTAEGGRVAWVEDVVVAPAYRNQGIGSLLLQTLEQWARCEGLKRLQLLADVDNRPAIRFYRAQGWRPTRLAAWRRKEGDWL